MGFNWDEYMELAHYLVGEPHNGQRFRLDTLGYEARQRSAISRAYYGAYCIARNYAQQHYPEQYSSIGNADHTKLWEIFKQSSNGKHRSVGHKGHNLRRTRNNADYDQDVSFSDRDVKKALSYAHHVINNLCICSGDRHFVLEQLAVGRHI